MDKKQVVKLIKSNERMDLHIHSLYSDGVLSPQEIIDRWQKDGYKTIAITDHDGIEGSVIGTEYAKKVEINFIPGIEFDSETENEYDLHILGYGIDFENEKLKEALTQVRKWRDERNEELINYINEFGYELDFDEVYAINNGIYIGKPTIAKALIARGYVSTVKDAFGKIIEKSYDKDIRKKSFKSQQVIDVIHAAGGIVILAHPIEQKKKGESWIEYQPRLLNLLDRFVKFGIDGIEVYHPSASEEQSVFLNEYADNHGLIKTRGSDFHYDGRQRDYSHYHK